MIVSGGAMGVDSYTVDLARKKGIPVKNIKPTSNVPDKCSRGLLPEIDMCKHIEGTEKILEANKTLKRCVNSKLMRTGLLQRNYYIIKDADVVLALGYFEDPEKQILQGGTGWTVQMAIDAKKPVQVYIEESGWYDWWYGPYGSRLGWYTYNYTHGCFVPSIYPLINKEECTAIVGSRNITDNMKRELERIFNEFFQKSNKFDNSNRNF